MNYFDVRIDGPGVWYLMHTMALHAKTITQKRTFDGLILHLSQHFECNKCRIHLQEFIRMFPVRKYYKNLFQWTWMLHNTVNIRLGKTELGYTDALYRYQNLVCHHCNDDDTPLSTLDDKESRESYIKLIS